MTEAKQKEIRNPGMDHPHYGFSAIPSRAPENFTFARATVNAN